MKMQVFVNKEKKTVLAKHHISKKVSFTGRAKCMKNDKFDEKWGIKLAMKRCAKTVFSVIRRKADEYYAKQIDIVGKDINTLITTKYPVKKASPKVTKMVGLKLKKTAISANGFQRRVIPINKLMKKTAAKRGANTQK